MEKIITFLINKIMAKILILCLIIFFILIIIYWVYQYIRSKATLNLILKWIGNGDKRYEKYSFNDILSPNKHNWFGLRYPKDKYYK